MTNSKAERLLLDANVLIDYSETDPSVLSMTSGHVADVFIATTTLNEIDELDPADCTSLGARLIEPELEEVLRSAEDRRPGLSFEDTVCLELCKKRESVCVTNDSRLRKECSSEGVRSLWGLELLFPLVDHRLITAEQANDIVSDLQRVSPRHVNETVISRFKEELRLRQS